MSKPKAKKNKISFNHKGENETTAYTKNITSWYKYNYYCGQLYLQM